MFLIFSSFLQVLFVVSTFMVRFRPTKIKFGFSLVPQLDGIKSGYKVGLHLSEVRVSLGPPSSGCVNLNSYLTSLASVLSSMKWE